MKADFNKSAMKRPIHVSPLREAETRAWAGGRRLSTAWLIGLALIGLVLAVIWLMGMLHAAWLWPGQSDSAAIVLLGKDFSQGNGLLSGWVLPIDSYWATEVPVYAVAVALQGVVFDIIHQVPLLFYLGVILSGTLIARRSRPGVPGWVGAAVTLVLLGLLGQTAAMALLHGPAHVSTTLACLLAIAALSAASPARPAGYIVSFILLTLALISDPIAKVIAVAPIGAVAVLTVWRNREWFRPLSQIAVAGLAYLASFAVHLAIPALGGYIIGGSAPGFVGPGDWPGKLPLFLSAIGGIFSAEAPSNPASAVLAAVHLLILAAAVAAALLAVVRLFVRPIDRAAWMDGVLAIAAGGTALAFFVSGYVQDETAIRYLSPGFICACVLLGRTTARLLPDRLPVRSAAFGLAFAAVYALTFVGTVRAPLPTNDAKPLAAWLLQHGLTNGYGGYWESNIVTLSGGERVRVLPVLDGSGGLMPSAWNTSLRWYAVNPAAPVTFLVYRPDAVWRGVDEAAARTTFGEPIQTMTYGPYRILVWDHDLAPSLRSLSS
jgi:hypothetical protein